MRVQTQVEQESRCLPTVLLATVDSHRHVIEMIGMKYGAAGFELDRVDRELGTPRHTLCLASSFGHSDAYQHTVEEVMVSDSSQGGTVEPRVRADLVYLEYPNQGAVFSTGSIAWCGALSCKGYENSISRITENVLRAFQADGPLPGTSA